MSKYVIGIDPGTHCGFAVWDCTSQKLIEVTTVSAHDAWSKIRCMINRYGAASLYIRFEDARLRKWFGKAGKEQLQGAGSIKRDCTLWDDFCQLEGLHYEPVAPKHNKTKTTAEYFRRITGWTGKTNEHGRDAALMIYQFKPLKHPAGE